MVIKIYLNIFVFIGNKKKKLVNIRNAILSTFCLTTNFNFNHNLRTITFLMWTDIHIYIKIFFQIRIFEMSDASPLGCDTPIIHVFVIGFHHKKGCVVSFITNFYIYCQRFEIYSY